MDRSDLGQAIYAGNDIAMQWYALTHQVVTPGVGTLTMQTNPDTGRTSLQVGSGALVLVGLALVAAVLILKK